MRSALKCIAVATTSVFACAVLVAPLVAEAEDGEPPITAPSGAGPTAEEPEIMELAIADQNPITRFYVMRIEDNVQFGFGPDDEALNFLRLQPLIPFNLGSDWTLLLRAIIPIVHVPWPETRDGLGDIPLVAFLTPTRSGKLSWGMGAVLLMPTATDASLGSEKWAAGPAVAGLYTNGPWVVGAVVQQVWSFAGDSSRSDVSTLTLRPLVNFNLPRGWYLTCSPSIVANWEAGTGDRWLVPLGGGVGKVYQIGGQRMSTTLEAYYHVVSPEIGPHSQLRIQHSFLYPD